MISYDMPYYNLTHYTLIYYDIVLFKIVKHIHIHIYPYPDSYSDHETYPGSASPELTGFSSGLAVPV